MRFEPQFHSTYAAFSYRGIGTRFYNRWQFEVLEYVARTPSSLDQIREIVRVKEDKLREFLASEINSGVIVETSEKPFPAVKIPRRTPAEEFKGFPVSFLSAPTTVDLFLTKACNLRCWHCFADGGIPLKNELSYEEWISVFDQLEEMGVLEIRLNGGEPFMRRRIYELLYHLENMRYHKLLITNGTLLTEKAVDALAASEITPTVSLDGATPQVHDAFRGVSGAFDKTVRAMHLLQERGLIYGVNTCVHRENIGQIEEIVQLAAKLGAARQGFLSLVPVGRMAEKEKLVSEAEYVMIGLTVLRLARKYRQKIELTEEIISDELPLQSLGLYTCSIDADGQVYPSNRVLRDPRFRVGSVRESTIREMWFSHKWIPFRQGSKKLRPFGIKLLF